MIGILLRKEWTRFVRSRFKSIGKNIGGTIINILIGVALFAFILFLFNRLNSKFVNYGVSDKLLVFVLGIVTAVYTLTGIGRIDRVVYDSNDLSITLSLPLKPSEVVISKAIGLYLSQTLSLFPILAALFISFGLQNHVSVGYVITAVSAVFLLPCWILLFSALLSAPFHYAKQFMANHSLVQLLVAVAVVAGFSYVYGQVLTIFIDLINDGRLAYLFNDSNMKILSTVNMFLIPNNFIVDIAIGRNIALSVPTYIIGSLAALGLSLVALDVFYRWIRNHNFTLRQNRRIRKARVASVRWALLKKEVLTLFRNSNYLLVYCTLLLSLGFINYAISSSLKVLVSRFLGSGFSFFPFAFLVLAVFAAVINGLGALVVSKEKENAVLLKVLPVSYKKQIRIKYGLLLAMTFVSLLNSGIILAIGKLLPFKETLGLIVSVFFLVAALLTNIVGKDLRFPNFQKGATDDSKVNYSLLAALVVPALFFTFAIMAFLFTDSIIMLIAINVLALLMFVLLYLNLMRRVTSDMQKMEV